MQKTANACRYVLSFLPVSMWVAVSERPADVDQPGDADSSFWSAMAGRGTPDTSSRLASQMSRVMRMLTVFLFAASLAVSARPAAQSVTISGENLSLEKVFSEIKKQTGYVVFFNNAFLQHAKPVTLSVSAMPLTGFLPLLLKEQPFTFQIEGKTISLVPKPQTSLLRSEIDKPPIEVTGRVVNENGEGISASVRVRGTNSGTTTSESGRFSLRNVADNAVLVISSIGFTEIEIPLSAITGESAKLPKGVKAGKVENGTLYLEISMQIYLAALSDVVVKVTTGYQTVSKDKMVGSAVTITAGEISKSSYNSISEILQGRVPGVEIYAYSGSPGTMPRVRIRGTNSINGNKEPLWIIDGLPLAGGVQNVTGSTVESIGSSLMDNGIGNIHPQDIESITVLKDASASAIYGAQAANGVIVITTKKGIDKEPVISYNGRLGIISPPDIGNLNMMNSDQKVDFELELMDDWNDAWNAGRAGRLNNLLNLGQINRQDYEAGIRELRNTHTNWFSEIFRHGIEQSHNFSIRGGGKHSTYYVSLSHRKEDGILINNTNKNTGLMLDYNFQGLKKLELGIGVTGNFKNNQAGWSAVDPFNYAVFANPYEKPYNNDGSYAGDATYLATNTNTETVARQTVLEGFNILRELNNNSDALTGSDLAPNLRALYHIIPGLDAEVRAGYAYSSVYNKRITAAGTYSNFQNNWATFAFGGNLPLWYNDTYGSLKETNSYQKRWTARGTVTYNNRIFNEKNEITVFLGSEWQSTETNFNSQLFPQYSQSYRIGAVPSFPDNPDLNYQDMVAGVNDLHSSGIAQTRYASFFGNFAYSYDRRYALSFNLRSDGADVIGKGSRFSPLWSVGARWNPLYEKFLLGQSAFSQLAFRASYGFTGNIDRNAYPFGIITLGNRIYNNNLVAVNFQFPNPYITWEKKKDVNIGVDFGLLNDLITGTFDYYNNETRDLLGQEAVPNSYGRASYTANVSGIANRGFDLGLNLNLKFNKDIIWQNSFNIGFNRTKLTRTLYKDIAEVKSNWGGAYNVQGEKYGDIYGQRYAGVDPFSGVGMIWLTAEGKQKFAEVYDIPVSEVPDKMRMDIPGQDIYIANLTPIANTVPELNGGFSSFLKVHDFDFSVFLSYVVNYDIAIFNDILDVPGNASGNNQLPAGRFNRSVELLERWRTTGDHSNIQTLKGGPSYFSSGFLDHRYEKGDYLNLRDAAIGYNFRKDKIQQFGVERVRVSFQMTNLFTLTRYSGIDVLTRGRFGYPIPRTFKFNLSVTL